MGERGTVVGGYLVWTSQGKKVIFERVREGAKPQIRFPFTTTDWGSNRIWDSSGKKRVNTPEIKVTYAYTHVWVYVYVFMCVQPPHSLSSFLSLILLQSFFVLKDIFFSLRLYVNLFIFRISGLILKFCSYTWVPYKKKDFYR